MSPFQFQKDRFSVTDLKSRSRCHQQQDVTNIIATNSNYFSIQINFVATFDLSFYFFGWNRPILKASSGPLPVHIVNELDIKPESWWDKNSFRSLNQVELLKFWTSSVFSIFCSFSCSFVYFAVPWCTFLHFLAWYSTSRFDSG